jgi:hypothetical protein
MRFAGLHISNHKPLALAFATLVATFFVGCSRNEPISTDTMMQSRFDTIDDFLHPSTTFSDNLEDEFRQQPYTEALVFTADTSLDEIATWYKENFAVHILERHDYDPGQITIYFHGDSKSREVSVLLADRSVSEATGNLTSYVASPLLATHASPGTGLVGVVFLEDVNQTIQRMKDNGEWPPG